jgi:hypothetical protein
MNYRADVHHDPQGPAAKIEQWPTGIAAYDTLTTEDRMTAKKAAKKPRIITVSVKNLRQIVPQLREHAIVLESIADMLDDTDARETRPDPSSRNARRRVKSK